MSIFGKCYRVFTFGQSHSAMIGCVIEGFPSNFSLNLQLIQSQLNRRRPGQSLLSTPRKESDQVECVSGIQAERTLGSPLCFLVKNQNTKREDYDRFANIPRPGHADYTYFKKYGIKAQSGGGRASARETIGRVIGGAVAKQYLSKFGIGFASWVYSVKDISIPTDINTKLISQKISNDKVDQLGYISEQINTRCPHPQTSNRISSLILETQKQEDSVGGIVQSCIYNLPVGLGEPVFDKIQAKLAYGMMSIPAVKGFEFGSGFAGTKMKGSQHNDMFGPRMNLMSNNCGGSLGGISSGSTFQFKVAFKPVSTIGKVQHSHNLDGELVELQGKGRHDPCVLPRAPPIVDNMAAMVIMDLLIGKSRMSLEDQIN